MFFKLNENNSDKVEFEQMDSTDLFKLILKSLFYKGNYNEAENLIFNELEKNNSPEVYKLSENFYRQLMDKSDEELQKADFSREEVIQGLEDIKHFKI